MVRTWSGWLMFWLIFMLICSISIKFIDLSGYIRYIGRRCVADFNILCFFCCCSWFYLFGNWKFMNIKIQFSHVTRHQTPHTNNRFLTIIFGLTWSSFTRFINWVWKLFIHEPTEKLNWIAGEKITPKIKRSIFQYILRNKPIQQTRKGQRNISMRQFFFL